MSTTGFEKYIGLRVSLHKRTTGGQQKLSMDERDSLYQEITSLRPSVRWRLPGQFVALNIVPSRLNVRVSTDGVIEDIFYG